MNNRFKVGDIVTKAADPLEINYEVVANCPCGCDTKGLWIYTGPDRKVDWGCCIDLTLNNNSYVLVLNSIDFYN